MKRKITKTKRVQVLLNSSDYALFEKYCNLYGFTKTKLIVQLLRSLEMKK